MKLLGWMHRKFNNGHSSSSTQPLGDFATGPTCNCLAARPSPDDPRHHFFTPAPAEAGEWNFQDPSFATPFLFEGLLTIGTFGSPVMMPAGDTAAEEQQIVEVEEIAEKDMEETTENDLFVVKAELQKVLAAEEEKEKIAGARISSSSAAAAVAGGKGDKECPLQGFLLGLPVEVGSTTLLPPENRHEHRASLGELFRRSNAEEELLPADKREELSEKGVNLMMKKMLKRRRTGRGNAATGRKYDAADSNKFLKILRTFHRKIYPESTAASSKGLKPSASEVKEKVCINKCHNKKDLYDNGSRAQDSSKEGEGEISISNPQPCKSLRNNRSRNQEHWIKTDEDYLVLEL